MPAPLRNKNTAFTLIELLVAIAIIGVLAAIAVPAYSGMIAGSKSSKCLSNLRQIGVAMIGYTAENGKFPCDPAAKKSWADYLSPYFPLSKTNSGNIKDLIYRCPAETNLPPKDFINSVNHYIATYTLYQSGPTGGISQTNGARSVAAVQNPSQTLLVLDGKLNPDNNSGYNCNTAATYTKYSADCTQADPANTSSVDFRHKNSLNAVYVDGHVGTISWTDRQKVTKANWEGRNY